MARGKVTSSEPTAKRPGVARQTPRVSITVRTALAKRALGRSELIQFRDWNDGRPESELNFKFYRQATEKIVGITDFVWLCGGGTLEPGGTFISKHPISQPFPPSWMYRISICPTRMEDGSQDTPKGRS